MEAGFHRRHPVKEIAVITVDLKNTGSHWAASRRNLRRGVGLKPGLKRAFNAGSRAPQRKPH
jgi:hypothetical protein